MKRRLLTYGVFIYAPTSYFFLKNPEYIHRKKDKLVLPPLGDQSHYNIAHRGGSLENPENTLQAFKHSVINQSLTLILGRAWGTHH